MKAFNLLQEHWRPGLNIINTDSGHHTTTHGDGETIWQEYTIIDGNLEGDYKEYHRNIGPHGMFPSILMVTGSFKNGKKIGKWTYYHDNGEIFFEDTYKNDKLNGKTIRYRGDSVLEYSGQYKDNKKHGKWIYYHDNGNRNCEGSYSFRSGKPIGEWTFFHHENESIYYTVSYEKNKEVGERVEYNLDGQLRRKFIINGLKKDGYYIEFDKADSNVILQEGKYKNDKLNGKWEVYKNGQVVLSRMYVDDKLDGPYLEFYPDGKRKRVSTFKDDKLEGEETIFNELDKVIQKTFYKNGKMENIFVSYHMNGVKWKECNYVNDELHGDYVESDDHGQPQCVGKYSSGKKIGQWNYYGKLTEKLKIENYNKNGELHGETILYFDNGDIVQKGNYRNGLKEGEWILRGKTGSCQIFNYEDNKKIGKWESYDENERLLYDGIIDKKTIGYHLNGNVYEVVEFKSYNEKSVISSRKRYTPVSKIMVLEEKYKNGNKSEVTKWYDTGELKFQCQYKGELEDGNMFGWYRNNKKWKSIEYKDGSKHGKSEEFFPNGNCKLRSIYVDGKLDGQYKEWFKNNQIRSKGKMIDGEMSGTWTFLYHNGQKESEIVCDIGSIKDGRVWLDSGIVKKSDKAK